MLADPTEVVDMHLVGWGTKVGVEPAEELRLSELDVLPVKALEVKLARLISGLQAELILKVPRSLGEAGEEGG